MTQQQPKLALLAWGNVLEDFLDPLGIPLEKFCSEFRGSYMFGYAEALQRAGVQTVLFCISARITTPSRYTHAPTGAVICVLPAPQRYHALRRRMEYPYGESVHHMFGEVRGARKGLLPLLFIIQKTFLYFTTPHRHLAREIRREGCDVILCQEYEYPRFDTSVIMGRLLGKPVFGTFQGGNYHHSGLERYIRPLSLHACTGLIIASKAEIQRVQTKYDVPPSKIAQIFNPVDLQNWIAIDRETVRAALGIPKDARVVAWHGRVSIHKKGLDILIDAWERLCREHPDLELCLLLIGTGDGEAELRKLLKSESIRGVTWVDQFFNDPSEIRQYLSAADVYAFPSRYEGFPVALIEAMACSLPVIASDIDGPADILAGDENNGGLMVPRDDPAAFAQALDRLLSDEALCSRLGTSARRRVEMSCSLEKVGKQLRSFLFNE